MENNKQNRVTAPLISIIIPVFNSADVLKDCLLSVIDQQEKNLELIVIDGGSTDGTPAILKEFEKYISCLVSEPDNGIYDAMNKGTKKATGKWLYFMGADDRLLPGFSQMATLLKDEDTLYYGDVESDGDMLEGAFSAYRLAKYCLNHQTLFYPAKVFRTYSYSSRYKVYADYALNIQCWGDSSIKKQYYSIKVVWYNLTGFSATTSDDLFKREKPQLIKQSMGWLMYLRFLYKRRKEQSKPGSNFY
ncbi:glycosyltransferase [Mucilaginibacter terrigena]|uniref:Glycosyltransferase n=1 Tax=Mucilaginibacter terrigena TaxID=2492395 RepID=A0A4Q5LI13_9SPHI|nr:glycosyltransferase family 2 protein [Mucilaginibacter terrigena]RYU87361.1 glycosyltransferase [Mucilaginibacter terrigena]